MKGKKLTIRPAISLDHDAIGILLKKNFQPVAIEKRKKLWEWRHNQNPAVEKDMPAFLVAEKSEQLVGVHGLILSKRARRISPTRVCKPACHRNSGSPQVAGSNFSCGDA